MKTDWGTQTCKEYEQWILQMIQIQHLSSDPWKNVLLTECCYGPAVEEEMMDFRTDAENHK